MNIRKKLLLLTFLPLGLIAQAQEELPSVDFSSILYEEVPIGFLDRFRFSCEWGYIQSLYRAYHYNIFSEEGYRIDERWSGFDLHPNASALLGVGILAFKERFMFSVYGGFGGIHENRRIVPLLLRLSFFPKTATNDGIFYFAQGGAGIHYPVTLNRQTSVIAGMGAGYRISLTEKTSIDFLISIKGAYSKPLIPNPDREGSYVSEENIRSNHAGYGALSFSIAVNI